MKKTKVVIIGDTHVGSRLGLNTPESVSEDKKSSFSEWNYKKYCEFCEKHHNPDYLILCGDICDGSQSISKGVDCVTTSGDEQVKSAISLLKQIIGEKTKVSGVIGSGYHNGAREATILDCRVIEGLGGECPGNVVEYELGDEFIQVSHGINGGVMRPMSGLISEMELATRKARKLKMKPPTIIVRGHKHIAYQVQDECGTIGVLNGCWQYSTPFMQRSSVNVSPNIGATIIEVADGTTKVFRDEYAIPVEVDEEMRGHEIIEESKEEHSKRLTDGLKDLYSERR